MAVIEKNIRLVGSKGEKEVCALFDSGSTYSCVVPELAKILGIPEKLPKPMEFETAKEKEKVTANERVSLDFYIDGLRLSDEFMLLPELSEQTIIGAKTLQSWRMKLDFEHDEVIIDPRVTKLRIIRNK
ncbi:MAG: retropepsin-like aspartic protease [bacterium]